MGRVTIEEALRDQETPEQRWLDAGIPPRFVAATLDNYQVENEGQRAGLAWAKSYAASFDDALCSGTSALLCGRTGTGKTHLAAAIAKHVADRGCSVRFSTVQRAIREVKDTWGREATVSTGDALKRFTKPDLLVLDEVGVQFGSDTERIILFDMLGERYDFVRPTILISNLPKPEVAQFLGDRVVDRMRENGGRHLVFAWDSYRAKPSGGA